MDRKLALIIDDEKDVLEHISSMLRSSNFEVITSESGEEGLKLAFEHKPDLILLDVFLPDIDGGAVASQLSEKQGTKNIPIIYLTGLVTKQESQEPERIGKHFMIAKPVLKEELMLTISKVLS